MSKHVSFYVLSKRVLSRFNGECVCHRCGLQLDIGDVIVSREVMMKVDENRSIFYHVACWEDMFV